MPAPRIRAVLMADGYATTGVGVALHQKFRPKASPRPAAAKRDQPKVVDHCRRPAAAVTPDTSNVVDFHMLLVVQLLAVLFTTTVAFWTHVKGQTTHEQSCAEGESHPIFESTKHPTMQTRSKEPLRSMDVQVMVNDLAPVYYITR
ncbi:hypothetical protein AC1031_000770 [Aphanomyces cochlioides]|nr:hypothetical protein AC1031_000770 [Aphanomyces cochlioides]